MPAPAIDQPVLPPPEESTPGQPLQKDSEVDVEFTERGHRDLPVNVNDDPSTDTDPEAENWSTSGSDVSDAEEPPPPSPKKKRGRPPAAPGQSKKERDRARWRKNTQTYLDKQEPAFFADANLRRRNARAAQKEARHSRKKDWRLSAGDKDIHKNTKQGRLNLNFDAATKKRHRNKASRAIHYIRDNLSGGHTEEFEGVLDAVAQQSKKRKEPGPLPAMCTPAPRLPSLSILAISFQKLRIIRRLESPPSPPPLSIHLLMFRCVICACDLPTSSH